MTSKSPHTVSLNEACLSDVVWIQGETGYSFPAMYEAVTNSGCGIHNGRRSYGNAAFAVGTSPGGYERAFPSGNAGLNEKRGFACMWAQTYVGRLVSCSAHMKNGNEPVAITQSNEYSYLVSTTPGTAGHSLAVLAGDFNFDPPDAPPVWGDHYVRIKHNHTFAATHPLGWLTRTLDYLWVKNPNYRTQVEVPGTNRSCDEKYSDHCYVWGTFS